MLRPSWRRFHSSAPAACCRTIVSRYGRKPIQNDVIDKFKTDATALAALNDVPEDYKALILGIRLGKLTDGATLRKAVDDLGDSIRKPAEAEPPQGIEGQAE